MLADDLFDRIREWGKAKGIDNPYTQMAKVTEEVGEIAHEISRGHFDTDELADAFGDTIITIVILSDICGMDLTDCIESAYNVIKDRTGHTENGGFVKDE